MLKYLDAEKLATAWLDITKKSVVISRQYTMTRPYGWVFFYDSRDPNYELIGNAPIIVERINCEIRVTGTARPIEKYLAEYEATLPEARLKLEPEFPPQAI